MRKCAECLAKGQASRWSFRKPGWQQGCHLRFVFPGSGLWLQDVECYVSWKSIIVYSQLVPTRCLLWLLKYYTSSLSFPPHLRCHNPSSGLLIAHQDYCNNICLPMHASIHHLSSIQLYWISAIGHVLTGSALGLRAEHNKVFAFKGSLPNGL